jgi:hypothetical protein
MNRSTNSWSTAVAAAALFALPVAASAQTPPATQPPAQPPTTQQPPPAQPASAQTDQNAAKQHLTAARDSLSQLTSLPEAAKLQGDSRTQVTQLISNFNELITTQANWRASYDKLNANLIALLGPDSPDPASAAGTAGAVGTSGASTADIDPAVRAKLAEFRTHLKAFEKAAGGAQPAASDTMPPAAATGSTSNPANPAQATQPPPPASATSAGVSGATGTSGTMPAADSNKAEADKHLDAISAILDASKTGTLTKAQTTELKKHVAALRKLLQEPK